MPRRSLHARAQAFGILGATLSLPGASILARIGSRPTSGDTLVAGVPTTVVRPATAPPWPALVFMNGATPDGRIHPTVQRLGLALGRAGIRAFIPDVPGVAAGELSPMSLADSVAVAEATADSPDTADGQIALAGVSIGATLALLTAAEPRLQNRISIVACVAPFGNLAEVMRIATTGSYRNGDRVDRQAAPPYLRVGLARSLAAMLAITPATSILRSELRALDPDSGSGVELPERAFRAAGPDAERLYDLLDNTDPVRFDELYEALPLCIRSAASLLSPIHVAGRFHAPVEIASAPHDRYFPIAEAQALAAASPHVRLTITSLLAHATPRLSVRYLAELRHLDAFFVRSFRAVGRVATTSSGRRPRPDRSSRPSRLSPPFARSAGTARRSRRPSVRHRSVSRPKPAQPFG